MTGRGLERERAAQAIELRLAHIHPGVLPQRFARLRKRQPVAEQQSLEAYRRITQSPRPTDGRHLPRRATCQSSQTRETTVVRYVLMRLRYWKLRST